MVRFTPEARAACDRRAKDKQLQSNERLLNGKLLAKCTATDLLRAETELRLANIEAEMLRQQNKQLQQDLAAYEQQRQDAFSALESYQQQVQDRAQHMQERIQHLQQHNQQLTSRLEHLELEHSVCAPLKAAGLQAAKERDRLWEDFNSKTCPRPAR